jgi:hypothetical protein
MNTTKKLLALGLCLVTLGLGACNDSTERDRNPTTLPDEDPATTPTPTPPQDPAQPLN